MHSDVISFDSLQDHFHHLVVDARDNQHVEVSDDTTHYLSSLLGFSDSSAFSRAFKRWTGTTPIESRIKA